ncbi:hypothetical protein NIES4073_42650 [Kalymmatonema gypsitolerans NIES-4073]|nr:hypothetical protein NIES4073_42650 [Scytonema sp. NIES-4073]
MPLELPNLDDRTYDDLVAEALSMIPTYAPEWTNHNPSDPGITLIELFAYLTEMQIYRLNRVTEDNVISFLKLLNGPDWQQKRKERDGENWQKKLDLRAEIRQAVLGVRQRYRAVTCEDFEFLALQADNRVARTCCVPRRDLSMDFDSERAGHISVIIVPKTDYRLEIEEIITNVQQQLEEQKLLGTYLHIVAPKYLSVSIETTVVPLPDEKGEQIKPRVENAVKKFLQPLGGNNEKVWPFGRNIFVSELYQLIDQIPGVNYVRSIDVQPEFSSRRIEAKDDKVNNIFVGIEVKPYELVELKEIKVEINNKNNN